MRPTKILLLGVAAAALLIMPRRSSLKSIKTKNKPLSGQRLNYHALSSDHSNNDKSNDTQLNNTQANSDQLNNTQNYTQ